MYGIVKNHGGLITVDSEPGKGSVFEILLPATDQVAVERTAKPAAVHAGEGLVLVVDDEEQVLQVCARMLDAMGYRPLTVLGGRAALDLVRQHKDDLALVILDLTMPDLTGADTFLAIREIAPQLKVLLCSGHTVEGLAQDLLSLGCSGFLQKPFDIGALSAKLKSLL